MHQTGWLATVANVGDSDVIMQTAKHVRELSTTHRLNDNDSEIDRLERGALPTLSTLSLFASMALRSLRRRRETDTRVPCLPTQLGTW